jgi:hypothetical protein
MRRTYKYLDCLLAAALLVAPALSTGCAARVRVYDSYHRDYHRWDDREDRAYRRYLSERHEEYQEMNKRKAEDQREYWNWRHEHPDHDRH